MITTTRHGWFNLSKFHKKHLWIKHTHTSGKVLYYAKCGLNTTIDPAPNGNENNPCLRCLKTIKL
jgi:hypothetical protein